MAKILDSIFTISYPNTHPPSPVPGYPKRPLDRLSVEGYHARLQSRPGV